MLIWGTIGQMENSRGMDRFFQSWAAFCFHNCFWQNPKENANQMYREIFSSSGKKKRSCLSCPHIAVPQTQARFPAFTLNDLKRLQNPSAALLAWGNCEARAVVAATLSLGALQAGEADGNVISACPHGGVSTVAA